MEVGDLKLNKADLKQLRDFKKKNFQDRLRYIDFTVEQMQKCPKKWSKEQNRVIDWQMD